MRKILVAAVLGVFVALPSFADTKTGTANSYSFQDWSIYNNSDGELKITLSWTRSATTVSMMVGCYIGGVYVPDASNFAGLNRYAEIVMGVKQRYYMHGCSESQSRRQTDCLPYSFQPDVFAKKSRGGSVHEFDHSSS